MPFWPLQPWTVTGDPRAGFAPSWAPRAGSATETGLG